MGPFRFSLCAAALLSACGLTVGPALATSCAFTIEWNGVRYDPWNNGPVSFGPSVGQARVPSCDDTVGGCERGHDESSSIEVFRIAGVDPHVALAAHDPSNQNLFLADGFFPQLPDHPLHELIYGSAQRPKERARAWQCEPIRGLTGEVVVSGWPRVRFEGDIVERDAGSTPLGVDAHTKIEGFDEFGLPRLLEGDKIQATVLECKTLGGRYGVIADSISPASIAGSD